MGKKQLKKKKAAKAGKAGGANDPNQLQKLKLLKEQMGMDAAPDEGVFEKLSNPSAAQRAVGCGTIALHLFQVPTDKVLLLCRFLAVRGTLAKLLQLLSDSNIEVATNASKALRNYCLVGGRAGCEEVQRQNGATAIVNVLKGPYATCQPLLTYVFPLLAALASNLERLDRLTPPVVLNTTFKALEEGCTDQPSAILAMEAAAFLFVVSEDNVPLARQLLSTEVSIKVLVGAMQHPASLDSTRSSCAGVLVNTVLCCDAAQGQGQAAAAAVLTPVFTTLTTALDLDLVALLSDMVTALKAKKQELGQTFDATPADAKDPDKDLTTQNDWAKITEEHVFRWKQASLCLTQTLEIITNLSSSNSEEDGPPTALGTSAAGLLVSSGILAKVAAKLEAAAGQGQGQESAMEAGCNEVLAAEETSVVLLQLRQARCTAITCLAALVLHTPPAVCGDTSGVLARACAMLDGGPAAEADALTALVWNVLRAAKEGGGAGADSAVDKPQLGALLQLARALSA